MKKLLAFMSVLILSVSCFVGCGDKSDSSSSQSNFNDTSDVAESEGALKNSDEGKIALQIYDLLDSQDCKLDFGKYNRSSHCSVATNVSEYCDTNSGVNKLIESKVSSDNAKWLVYERHYSERQKEQFKKNHPELNGNSPNFWVYVVVPYGDNTIVVIPGGIILVETKTFDEYFKDYSSYFVAENIANSIDVDKIISEYENNAINAATEYAQKNIVISGKVKSVETASYSWEKEMGSCIVSVYNSSSYDYIKCFFLDSNDVSSLNSGDKIYIEGTFVGEVKGSIYLHMKNCKIVND